MKKAILTMDVEDWYHLDYFDRNKCDTSQTMLDGLDEYIEFINHLSLPSSFFVLGEIAEKRIDFFRDLVSQGHDVSSHGWDHKRPMTMDLHQFENDLKQNINVMRKINGDKSFGYRAPCFSIDRERLEIVKNCGFSYDSSLIDFSNHPLYGSIDMNGFENIENSVYVSNDFIEFETTTTSFMSKNIPISGGGYLRIFPWFFIKKLINDYLLQNDLYVFYIHPFELSKMDIPRLPNSTSRTTRFRFNYGRNKVQDRLKLLIDLLDSHNYSFTTFSKIQAEMSINNGN